MRREAEEVHVKLGFTLSIYHVCAWGDALVSIVMEDSVHGLS